MGLLRRPRIGRRQALLLAAVVVFAAGFVGLSPARGAVRTWNGGGATNNWNLAGNWVGGLVPGAGDVATFDGTSAKNATVNVSINVAGIDIQGTYLGVISQAAGSTVTIGASGFSEAGGTFTGGADPITITGPFSLTGGSFTSTSGTLSVSGAFTHALPGAFNAPAGTVALTGGAATIDVPVSDTFNNLTHTAGAKTIAAGDTLNVTGTLALNGGSLVGPTGTVAAAGNITQAAAYAGGTATLLINGAGAQTFTGSATTAAGSLPAVVINDPAGTLTLAGTIRTTNGWTYTAGTVAPGASTVVFAGALTISGNQTLANVTFNGAGTTYTLTGTTLSVTGTLALTDGSIAVGTVAAAGDITQASTFDGGTGTLLINGAGAQTFTGSATTAAGSLPAVVINDPAGTLTLAGTIRTTNGWTYTAGTVAPGASTVVFAGALTISGNQTLANVTFNGAGTTYTLTGTTLSVTGTLALTDGSIAVGTVAAAGDITQASTFDGGTGTLLINGAGAQTFTGSATTAAGSLPAVVINDPAGTLTLAGTIRTTNGWTYTAGTVAPGASTVVFAGALSVTGSQPFNNLEMRGAVTVPGGTTLTLTGTYLMPVAVVVTLDGTIIVPGLATLTDGTINGTGSLQARGDITQASTFDGGTGTLLINGAGAQTFTGSATTAAGRLPAVVINDPAGTLTLAGTIRTTNGWTYTAGTVAPGASTVVFAGALSVTGSQPFNNLEMRGAVTVPGGTTLTLTGTYLMPVAVVVTLDGTIIVPGLATLTDGTINGTGSLQARGDITQASTFDGGTGTLLINGAGAQTFTGSATTAAGRLPAVVINDPAGTLTLAGTIRTTNGWTYTAGTVAPGASTVVFAGALTISGNQTLANVTFNGAGTTYTLTGTTLSVTGTLALTDGSIAVGTVAAAGDITQASTFDGGTGTLLINGAGAQTFTGSATTAAGSLPAVVINDPAGTLTLAGTIRTTNGWTYTAGTVAPGASTVVFAGALSVTGSQPFNNLEMRGAVTVPGGTTLTLTGTYLMPVAVVVTLDGTIIVPGLATLTDGTINGTGSLQARGDITQASTFDGGTGTLLINGAGAQTFTGSATTAAGRLPAVVINDPAGTLTLAGTIRTTNGWTYTAGTVAPGASTVVFAGALTINSAGMGFYDVRINGGTSTLASALLVGHDLVVSAGTITTGGGSSTVTVGNDLTITGTFTANASLIAVGGNLSKTGTFTAGTSTILLDGTAGQTISGTAWTMRNLTVDDPAGATMATNVSATGTLTLTTGPLVVGANTLTIANPIAGVTTNLTAGSTSSISVVGVAAGISIPTSVTQLANLTVNDAAGLSLDANLTVNGTVTLTSGPILTGPNVLIVAPGGSVVRTTGRVAGNLRKTAAAGSPVALTFEIGDVTSYTPLSLAFGTVSTPGTLTAWTTTGEHPAIASSGVDPTQDVNRYWTVINGGVVFDVYSATFTFVAGDIDVGANPLIFRVAKDDLGSWTMPTAGVRTALTTQATGMTTFSDFGTGEPEADLALTKTDGVGAVTAGDGLTYTYLLTVTNAGPADDPAVVLTDSWPTGFSQGSITASQGSCTLTAGGPDFSCALGTVGAGASATVSVTFSVPAALAGGPQTNTASVAGGLADPTPANDSASDTDTVAEVADLAVTKTDGLASVQAGTGGHAYTITVTNNGPSDADGVILADGVPGPLTAGVPSADLGGDCSGSSGNTVTCSLPTSLAPGATWTVTIPYAVAPAAALGPVTNTVTVVSDENPIGIEATDATTVIGQADLALTKTDGVGAVTAGDGLTYTYLLTVTNAGPADDPAVVLTDSWPTGFSQGSITASQGSCTLTAGGPDFSCALGTVGAGASATVSVTFSVPAALAGGPQTNTASVAGGLADPTPANDSASDTDTVAEVADLAVTKTDGLASVQAGTGGHAYTITVTNNGPSDADGVILADGVPGPLTAGVPSADLGGDCSGSSGNTVTCSLPTSLAPGATWTVTIPYAVAPAAALGPVTNTVTVVSDENPIGIEATDATTVIGQAATPTPTGSQAPGGGSLPDTDAAGRGPLERIDPGLAPALILFVTGAVLFVIGGFERRRRRSRAPRP